MTLHGKRWGGGRSENHRTKKFTPREHTFRLPLTEMLRCAQKQTSILPLGPSQPQAIDVRFKTQAHSDAWALTVTPHSGK